MSVNKLHLLDPRCKGNDNDTHLIIQFAYDSCGTYIKKKSSDLTRFINILRDDPEPYKTSSLITRAQRQVNMRIICDVEGVGIANVFIDPNTSVASSTFKGKTILEANLELYEDRTYSTLVPYGTAKEVMFSERLFFAARARDSSKEIAIESCRATSKYKTCSKFDKKYEFISNGCPIDDTVRLTPNSVGSLDQKRFSIKTFTMINYGVDDTVWVMCSFLTCDQSNTQSACNSINSQDCGSPTVGKRRKRSATDVVTQAFMEVQI
ncbi:CUB and zona pellucida-like domain-containing protein 1 [Anneissia japonica]|uniref:CUB and zona pellucida-like domain-containing protein 1 n=1 Tax=Anneissia japonica TaxID=1529436 RepID=UPI0014257482|nr:CUB and zona pellucida-like domain-containing protein 1 [Anneissia japonica]